MHKCEPTLEELYNIKESLIDDLAEVDLGIDFNGDEEIRQKLYAVCSQISRQVKQKESEVVE